MKVKRFPVKKAYKCNSASKFKGQLCGAGAAHRFPTNAVRLNICCPPGQDLTKAVAGVCSQSLYREVCILQSWFLLLCFGRMEITSRYSHFFLLLLLGLRMSPMAIATASIATSIATTETGKNHHYQSKDHIHFLWGNILKINMYKCQLDLFHCVLYSYSDPEFM